MRKVCSMRSGVTWRVSASRPALFVTIMLTAIALLAGSHAASAEEGFFDFLFGGSGRWEPPWRGGEHPPPPAPVPGRIAPAPLGRESVTEGGGSTGHGVAFCVRLCDGHHFPMEQMVKDTAR